MRVRSHRHSTASPLPSLLQGASLVQTCCRRMQGWGLSPLLSPPSCREAQPDTGGAGSLSPVRVQPGDAARARPDASTQRLAQAPQQGAAAARPSGKGRCPLWAFAVRPPGAASWWYRGEGCRQVAALRPQDACPALAVPSGAVYTLYRAAGRAKGRKFCVWPTEMEAPTTWAALGC